MPQRESTNTDLPDSQETVVLLHGYGGHRWLMAPLASRLRLAGYRTVNWGYRSLFADIEWHADCFRQTLESLDQQPDVPRIHIVAHSMGGLVTRQALLDYRPQKLGRIVLICPPNRGSHAASFYAPRLGWLSKTLTQLSDAPDGFANQLPATLAQACDLGIIVAETDFVVRRESTHLPFAKQQVVISGFHSSVLFHARTAALAARFIAQGSF